MIEVDAEHLHLLNAMGVDVYVSRSRLTDAVGSAADASTSRVNALTAADQAMTAIQLVAVCARGARAQACLSPLLGQLPQILGVAPTAIHWLEADAQGTLVAAPSAPAYLVFGAAMARALGVQLSTMQQNSSVIAVTAEPEQLPGSAMQKRALWQVLKPLAQRLRAKAQ